MGRADAASLCQPPGLVHRVGRKIECRDLEALLSKPDAVPAFPVGNAEHRAAMSHPVSLRTQERIRLLAEVEIIACEACVPSLKRVVEASHGLARGGLPGGQTTWMHGKPEQDRLASGIRRFEARRIGTGLLPVDRQTREVARPGHAR